MKAKSILLSGRVQRDVNISTKYAVRRHLSIFRTVWFWFLLSVLTACASLPAPPKETSRVEWGPVVIAPARFTPATNFEAFAVGKGKGAAKGAAIGAGVGAAGAAGFALGGPLCAVIAPYLAVLWVPTMAGLTGAAGYAGAVTAEEAKAVDDLIQRNLKALNIQAALAALVAETVQKDTGQKFDLEENAGPETREVQGDYRELARKGFGGALEIAVMEIGFDGYTDSLHFFMVTRARVIRPGDGESLYEREFVYESEFYDVKHWAADNAALFEAELSRAYAIMAESIVEQVFLLTELPLDTKYAGPAKMKSDQLLYAGVDQACGIAWCQPPRDFHPSFTSDQSAIKRFTRFTVIATRTPTLEWQPFPRSNDQHPRYASLLKSVSNVRYDLRIWKVADDFPPQIVYERRALTDPEHTLEQPLESGTRYFWSIRARFDVDGLTHATRWGCYRTPIYQIERRSHIKGQASFGTVVGIVVGAPAEFRDPCNLDFIPTANYYRFMTP